MKQKYSKANRYRSGNTLLLAILMTLLLFIVGITFLSTAVTNKTSSQSSTYQMELDNGVDVVVDKIGDVLVQDLFGSGLDKGFLDGTAGNEPYDYPGPPDRWLASAEPEVFYDPLGNPYYGWRQYSDLWGEFGEGEKQTVYFAYHYDPPLINRAGGALEDPRYWNYPDVNFSYIHRIEGYAPLVCDIVDPEQEILHTLLNIDFVPGTSPWPPYTVYPTDRREGMRADADGDGVADSRWVRLDRLGPDGKYLWAAVRIVDNGSMINLNTAFRNPSTLATPGNWDGTQLTHINLNGIIAATEVSNLYDLQLARCGTVGVLPAQFSDFNHDIQYHNYVASRVLNPYIVGPGLFYTPFDIADELELRNRFFLFNPGVVVRSTNTWPVTLNPQGAYGKFQPYFDFADLGFWFDKASATNGLTYYLARHFCTTYSFDRITRPVTSTALLDDMRDTNGWRKCPIYNPGTMPKNDYIKQLAGAIYRGLPNDNEIDDRFDTLYKRENLAWNMALNLLDYQDDDATPGFADDTPSYILANNIKYWGVEDIETIRNNTICISEVGYIDVTDAFSGTPKPPADEYYAVELYNPGTVSQNLNDFELWIGKKAEASITKKVSLSGTISSGEVVVVTNLPEADAENAFADEGGISQGTASVIPEESDLEFSSSGADRQIMVIKKSWDNMPVDCIEVPSDVVSGINEVNLQERTEQLSKDTEIILSVPGVSSFWQDGSASMGDPPTLNNKTKEIPLSTSNSNLLSVGEIEKVLAVGYRFHVNSGECHTLAESIYISEIKMATDKEPGTTYERASTGRINMADPNYFNLTNYLNYFDPSNDGVDNDGDIMTSDDPNEDDVDQDGDGIDFPGGGLSDSDTDEDKPQWYEQTVAGRININTAPWFVIKQLPWLALENDGSTYTNYLALAITAWRDKLDLTGIGGPDYSDIVGAVPDGRQNGTGLDGEDISEEIGFRNIAELTQVINTNSTPPDEFDIRKYLDGIDNLAAPASPEMDTVVDGFIDDLEERNLIFHRISNLVTVRSDVFTAYILVRLGRDGPQKRMIAIFDRSNVFDSLQRPKLVALHPVPDPR
ncbi:MAG: hypothetical protein JXD22_10030 [Sedimentisphaerales bacterium]|nr:hypothetical protein [Sedimentisphaerales bacterium]